MTRKGMSWEEKAGELQENVQELKQGVRGWEDLVTSWEKRAGELEEQVQELQTYIKTLEGLTKENADYLSTLNENNGTVKILAAMIVRAIREISEPRARANLIKDLTEAYPEAVNDMARGEIERLKRA